MFLLNLGIYQAHRYMPQCLIFAFFLETVVTKFKKVTKNDLRKYLMDQLKYVPDRIDGGG